MRLRLVSTFDSWQCEAADMTLDLHVPPDDPGADERCRKVEYGAKLIVVIPSIYAVVLQMPRGNLETIYPRALILASVRYSIDAKQYKRAFLACRKNRMDLNILHDHNPAQFLSNVPLFIRQLHKLEHVDLFLSQLRYSGSAMLVLFQPTL